MWCKFLFTGCLFARFYAKKKKSEDDKNLRSFFLIYFLLIISRALGPSWLGVAGSMISASRVGVYFQTAVIIF